MRIKLYSFETIEDKNIPFKYILPDFVRCCGIIPREIFYEYLGHIFEDYHYEYVVDLIRAWTEYSVKYN